MNIRFINQACIKNAQICRVIINSYSRTDAALSVRASFNDTRCDGGSVCPTDPLLFTCEVNETTSSTISVAFHSDMLITIILLSTDMISGVPPDGVTVFHSVTMNNGTNDYILSLSIETASLLNDGMIECNPGDINNVLVAECPMAGEFNYVWCFA